ncbi:MAG: LLM class F420-dependent oxidoreductase [Gammaproteobacteria bacterium]|nr:MAG: LLM class F420-dependent oxidoreductase [Gammaproteobacteria bacterium]
MKFGLIPVNIGVQSPEQIVELAQLAESLRFESVWTFEHVIVPLDYASKYPYNPTGKMGAAPETNFVDPLIALSVVAQATSTIRLGTGVNILSQVNPLYMAKQAASLDFVSGGRFMLGVGIGWLKEEFDALGVAFERRGARFDDYLVAMKKIWSGEVVEHDSDFLTWHGFKSYPVPVQKPHLPVIIGGSKGKIFERIAKHGDGWFAPTGGDELKTSLDTLRTTCAAVGRDFSEIEITTMWPGQGGNEAVQALADMGVGRLVVPTMALGADPVEGIRKLAAEVIG